MNRRKIVTVCATALLIAAVVVVASRGRRRELPLPEAPIAVPVAEVRVKAVERKMWSYGHTPQNPCKSVLWADCGVGGLGLVFPMRK